MSYIKIILALLQIVDAILDWSKERRFKQEGADEEIARAAIRVLQKTEYSKRMLTQARSMSESDILDYLQSLEPVSDGRLLPNIPATDPAKG
jgi:hypothetical protein